MCFVFISLIDTCTSPERPANPLQTLPASTPSATPSSAGHLPPPQKKRRAMAIAWQTAQTSRVTPARAAGQRATAPAAAAQAQPQCRACHLRPLHPATCSPWSNTAAAWQQRLQQRRRGLAARCSCGDASPSAAADGALVPPPLRRAVPADLPALCELEGLTTEGATWSERQIEVRRLERRREADNSRLARGCPSPDSPLPSPPPGQVELARLAAHSAGDGRSRGLQPRAVPCYSLSPQLCPPSSPLPPSVLISAGGAYPRAGHGAGGGRRGGPRGLGGGLGCARRAPHHERGSAPRPPAARARALPHGHAVRAAQVRGLSSVCLEASVVYSLHGACRWHLPLHRSAPTPTLPLIPVCCT